MVLPPGSSDSALLSPKVRGLLADQASSTFPWEPVVRDPCGQGWTSALSVSPLLLNRHLGSQGWMAPLSLRHPTSWLNVCAISPPSKMTVFPLLLIHFKGRSKDP